MKTFDTASLHFRVGRLVVDLDQRFEPGTKDWAVDLVVGIDASLELVFDDGRWSDDHIPAVELALALTRSAARSTRFWFDSMSLEAEPVVEVSSVGATSTLRLFDELTVRLPSTALERAFGDLIRAVDDMLACRLQCSLATIGSALAA